MGRTTRTYTSVFEITRPASLVWAIGFSIQKKSVDCLLYYNRAVCLLYRCKTWGTCLLRCYPAMQAPLTLSAPAACWTLTSCRPPPPAWRSWALPQVRNPHHSPLTNLCLSLYHSVTVFNERDYLIDVIKRFIVYVYNYDYHIRYKTIRRYDLIKWVYMHN